MCRRQGGTSTGRCTERVARAQKLNIVSPNVPQVHQRTVATEVYDEVHTIETSKHPLHECEQSQRRRHCSADTNPTATTAAINTGDTIQKRRQECSG
jgi:hypothetical protein